MLGKIHEALEGNCCGVSRFNNVPKEPKNLVEQEEVRSPAAGVDSTTREANDDEEEKQELRIDNSGENDVSVLEQKQVVHNHKDQSDGTRIKRKKKLRTRFKKLFKQHKKKKRDKGVSIYHMHHMLLPQVEELREVQGNENLNIYDINDPIIKAKGKHIICPRDKKKGAAYVDCLKGKDHVGIATFMISYCWLYDVVDIINTLWNYCQQNGLDPKREYMWICCLCNNMHRINTDNNVPFEEMQELFRTKVVGIGKVVAMLTPWDNPVYIQRVWCIFELFTAFNNEDDGCKLEILLPENQRENMFGAIKDGDMNSVYDAMDKIDIMKANATKPRDKENILKIVEDSKGGATELNQSVKDFLREWIHKVIDDRVTEAKNTKIDGESLATLYYGVGTIYSKEGLFDKSLEHLKKCLAIRQSLPEPNDRGVSDAYNEIALAYRSQGKYDMAVDLYKKCLSIRESILKRNDPDLARTYDNLAKVYRKQGRFEDALELHMMCLGIEVSVLDANHSSLAITYNNIGVVYLKLGNYDKALEFHNKSLAIREAVIGGSNHPDLATTYNWVGVTYEELGNYENALDFHSKALAIRESVLDSSHPILATTYQNIGTVLEKQGDYKNAIEFYKKCLVILESSVPIANQIGLANIYQRIGWLYYKKKNYEQALEFLNKCLFIRESILEPNHPKLARTHDNISTVLDALNRNEEATKYRGLSKQVDVN